MKKVLTYGTFDLFHQGHYNILKRAKELGDYLIVGVTSESFDIERGKIGVRDSLPTRINNVRETGFADEIIIEEFQGQKVQDVQKYNIDIFVVGSDWIGKFDYLKAYCDVVYLERTKNISSTQIRTSSQFLRFGIIIESEKDNDFVLESKYVSGVHVDRVFSENYDFAQAYCKRKELDLACADMTSFLDGIDAVYIQDATARALQYAKKAISAKKHVVFSLPVEWPDAELQELIGIAQEKQVVLLPCLHLAYNKAINQLLWMIESGVLGEVKRIYASLSDSQDNEISIQQMCLYALYIYSRLSKKTYPPKQTIRSDMKNGGLYYSIIDSTEQGIFLLEIGKDISIPCKLSIMGDNAALEVPEDWWNTGYFEIIDHTNRKKKRYSYNFEGSGMRYILQELLIMLREGKMIPVRFTCEECIKLSKLLRNVLEA